MKTFTSGDLYSGEILVNHWSHALMTHFRDGSIIFVQHVMMVNLPEPITRTIRMHLLNRIIHDEMYLLESWFLLDLLWTGPVIRKGSLYDLWT